MVTRANCEVLCNFFQTVSIKYKQAYFKMKLESVVYLLGGWSMRENNLEADKKGSFSY